MDVMESILSNPELLPGETVFYTPSKRREFIIKKISIEGMTLKVGKTGSLLRIPAPCVNNLPDFLKGRGRVKIGSRHDDPVEGSVDWFLRKYSRVSCASYLLPILEAAGMVKIDHRRPNMVRLL